MDKKQFETFITLNCVLADKALAAQAEIIDLILSWILNRAKEVVG